MKEKVITSLVAGALALTGLTVGSKPIAAQDSYAKYYCGTSRDGVPTTFWSTETGGRIPVIRWQKQWGDGSITPQERCTKVSANFQAAYERGVIKYLTYGIANNQKVICSTGDFGGKCEQTLFTLRSNEDPNKVIQALLEGINKGKSPFTHDNGELQYYYNMEQILEQTKPES